jgi:hypothetical protein
MTPPSSKAYEEYMDQKRLPAETVTLPHGTVGHWIGKKDAKNVLVYYHGTHTQATSVLHTPKKKED